MGSDLRGLFTNRFPLAVRWYSMGPMTETVTRPFASAIPPTEADLAAWRALSGDEQLARYREVLLAPDAQRVSQANMADVLTAARERVAARRG